MRTSRIDEMDDYLMEHKSATIDELCALYGISVNTVRRDLNALVARGSVKKVYGGAVSLRTPASDDRMKPTEFRERLLRNKKAKSVIASAAASFVSEGDIIFLDSGSTVYRVIKHLKGISGITVITNSIAAVNEAMAFPDINLIVIPGILKRSTASTFGTNCVDFLENYNIDVAFLACTAISEQFYVCNSFIEESALKKAVLEKSNKSCLLADSSKFGKSALMTYGMVDDFDAIITDRKPESSFQEGCRERNCKIIVA
ncbi:MAG: DeoR/GlpR family DNA-binding transcription regulator [Lachnospiraceae bacterium]|nr:DeoR/GlpR family DNA-binding transcription regulator [Lachnospiraceae bacterium]